MIRMMITIFRFRYSVHLAISQDIHSPSFAVSIHIRQSPVYTLQSPFHTLQSPSHTLQSPVHTLQSPVHTLQSPVHTLQSPVHTLQSPVRTLQTKAHTTITSPRSTITSPHTTITSPHSTITSPHIFSISCYWPVAGWPTPTHSSVFSHCGKSKCSHSDIWCPEPNLATYQKSQNLYCAGNNGTNWIPT
jgi:DNA-directed RNA polymerase II subunit RPB1